MNIQSIKNRIYSDYFLPSRLEDYKNILITALDSGYDIVSVIGYYNLIASGDIHQLKKVLICRHDIDTDLETARCFLKIETELMVQASYYFRLSTFCPELMIEIEQCGSEAGYHFEEISSFCKRHKIKDRKTVMANMSLIQEEFYKDYMMIKKKTGLPLYSVASHGDFVNRYLNIVNYELLDSQLKDLCGIKAEAYDKVLLKNCQHIISDTGSPLFWVPEHIYEPITRKVRVIYWLTHPRHWRANWWANTKDNITRLWEGVKYYYL